MKNLKIRNKILAIFLVAGLIPMLIISVVAYYQARTGIQHVAFEKTQMFGEMTERRMDQYFNEKLTNGWILSQTARIQQAVEVYTEFGPGSQEWQEVYRGLEDFLPGYAEEFGLRSIFITTDQGAAIYASGQLKNQLEGADVSIREYFQQSISGTQNISEFDYSDIVNDYYIVVSTPLRRGGTGEVIGTVNGFVPVPVVQAMLQEGIEQIGNTADVYLIDADGLLYTNTMRGAYSQNAAFNERIQTQAYEELAPQIRAANDSFVGVGTYDDYAGNGVVGSFGVMSIGATDLGWIVEIDSSEALVTANRLMITMIILTIGALLLAVIIIVFSSKSITKPIQELVGVAEKLAVGNTKVEVVADSTDEIGQLKNAFAKTIGNQQHDAEIAMAIASGNLDLEIQIMSEDDELAKSLREAVTAIRALVQDTRNLAEAAIEGKLDTRADANRHNGDFALVIQGVNETLDAVIDPIKEASAVLEEMSQGNLKKRVTGNYKGDHALIKNALNSTLEAISGYVTEISDVLTEMANKNMNVGIEKEYKGDFQAIKEALTLIIDSLNEVLAEVNEAADQVTSGSGQVADSSQQLSQGATEQASSVEQITASMEELSAQTTQNANNAGEANDISQKAMNDAEQGNQQMKEMLKSMQEINESSNKISKIIKVIDEIAFQTNILALNAAVEAARAGQHGKGFAVVAEEVRNLAARSADAARETTEMIETSIEKVGSGTEIANKTAEALENIVNGVADAARLVGEIADASNEQASGIEEVNQAIMQVSQVVQTNSATSEEAAAASEELSSQAQLLKESVNQFRLKKNGQKRRSSGFDDMNPEMLRMLEEKNESMTDEKYEDQEKKGKKRIALDDKEFGKY
ncbi:X-X-X-Leu-X-X-Gly heptad repeat-containing protein [Tindallia magadiensis]|uniref:X-X-X-Leu-X-X-Gly heptad repeat-containing protein n=1 Tax=Tindallia magadiensis TaxID=69895 RepID=A0A1I3FGW9_9FIRM|nr:methyl-accepting chemotaxis protein [Tindallia magadiensis]SFI10455.1 X-X-X-Leu-X-X-Gly heptad repeat-containing protein [Tindallia magadiensis]